LGSVLNLDAAYSKASHSFSCYMLHRDLKGKVMDSCSFINNMLIVVSAISLYFMFFHNYGMLVWFQLFLAGALVGCVVSYRR